MRLRSCPWLGLAVLLGGFLPSPVLADLEADVDRGEQLLSEGDTLADRGETTEADIRYKQAFEQLLPGLRGLPFKHEVQRDITPREDLRKVVLQELDEEKTPEEFRSDELGLKALGLIPRDLDLKDVLVRLLSEEIAAFYDPKTETIHLIREPAPQNRKKPSFLERLLGQTGGFDKDEHKTVLAHELTHALADQHYNLEALQDRAKGDDDRDLALSTLIEGEATLAMISAQAEDWDGSMIVDLPADRLEKIINFMSPLLPKSSGRTLREVPPILSESLIFPYMRGLIFCAQLTNHGGWKAIDAAYADPPLSTEQVLHPQKYRGADRDVPMTIDLGRLEPPPGWSEVGRNVLGEMQMSVLLRGHNAKTAAAGWDGDRYAVFSGPDDQLGLVWATTWDSETDAREFASSYAEFQEAKIGPQDPQPVLTADDPANPIRRAAHGASYVIERRGREVVIVEGFPVGATDALLQAALRAEITEKTQDQPTRPPKEPAPQP